jgi:hypothetical protein
MMERFQRDEPGGGTAVRERPADTRGTAERVSLRAIRALRCCHRMADRAGFSE